MSVVQPAAQRLIERAQAEPGYGGAWFENSPCYRLVLAFTDGQPRWPVIEAAEPWLRPYLSFARSRFTEAERNAAAESIRKALSQAGIRWAFFDEGAGGNWTIHLGSQADVDRARAIVPARCLPITRFAVGIPVITPERG